MLKDFFSLISSLLGLTGSLKISFVLANTKLWALYLTSLLNLAVLRPKMVTAHTFKQLVIVIVQVLNIDIQGQFKDNQSKGKRIFLKAINLKPDPSPLKMLIGLQVQINFLAGPNLLPLNIPKLLLGDKIKQQQLPNTLLHLFRLRKTDILQRQIWEEVL
jgi:hypothetical protein